MHPKKSLGVDAKSLEVPVGAMQTLGPPSMWGTSELPVLALVSAFQYPLIPGVALALLLGNPYSTALSGFADFIVYVAISRFLLNTLQGRRDLTATERLRGLFTGSWRLFKAYLGFGLPFAMAIVLLDPLGYFGWVFDPLRAPYPLLAVFGALAVMSLLPFMLFVVAASADPETDNESTARTLKRAWRAHSDGILGSLALLLPQVFLLEVVFRSVPGLEGSFSGNLAIAVFVVYQQIVSTLRYLQLKGGAAEGMLDPLAEASLEGQVARLKP